jgi:hyperosmotically inducible periplasmic protein
VTARVLAPWLLLGAAALLACGRARPDDAMARAARSQETLASRLEDRAMKADILANLMEDRAVERESVTPHVYRGHAFLVGSVRTPAQRDAAIADARRVEGVRSVKAYLPQTRGKRSASRTTADARLKSQLERRLSLDPALTHIDLAVIDGHAVLLGVVPSQEAVQLAGTTAQGTDGIAGVTNFLLVPEEGYERRRPGPGG